MVDTKRFLPLDVFRGITIAAMILVNTPGSWSYVLAPLQHSAWHGCTPTDLVFPFFLFSAGMSMWFSFRKYKYALSYPLFFKIIKRTVLLFTIGFALNAFPFVRDYADVRIMGVLQRIALAYFFSSLLCLSLKPRRLLSFGLLILIAYWLLLFLFGGEQPFAIYSNIVYQIDCSVLGENHMWHMHGQAFDPEGILSTIPCISQMIFGFLAAKTITDTKSLRSRAFRSGAWGLGFILTGLAWSIILPLNKSLWTSSYTIFSTGCALVFMCVLILLVDGLKLHGRPFLVFGSNPLFSFVLSMVWVLFYMHIPVHLHSGTVSLYGFLFSRIFSPLFGPMAGSFAFALVHLVIFWIIALILFKKRIFIKL